MANFLQKCIYVLSNFFVIGFVYIIVEICGAKHVDITILYFIGGFISFLAICFIVSFWYGRRNIAPTKICISRISPCDKEINVLLCESLIPAAEKLVDGSNSVVLLVIGIILILASILSNNLRPNIFLMLLGYHFYEVDAGGISNYLLVSKRALRKTSDVKVVKRFYEFLILDAEEY